MTIGMSLSMRYRGHGWGAIPPAPLLVLPGTHLVIGWSLRAGRGALRHPPGRPA
ncbi:hypothetical protein [Nonomuraea sp. NPDC050691]|uniref:hypothetical protein n=1 Tax=Nonomuraea sp. NPDC050691 TaxID=3155661 RepID=UPI0033D36582